MINKYRTAVRLWLQETLMGPMDSELEDIIVVILFSTNYRHMDVLLFEGGQNEDPPLPSFPRQSKGCMTVKNK